MIRFLLLLFAYFAVAFTHTAAGDDTWQVLLNKQIIFEGVPEAENTTASIKTFVLKKTDSITIRHDEKKADKKWRRFIYINDSSDNNLKTLTMNEQTGQVSVNASVIKNNINTRQPVFIYTMALPKDKTLAARIRVRRVLLCKIEWN